MFCDFQATGDVNKLIHVWDAGTLTLIHTFKGHRDTVTVSVLSSLVADFVNVR